MNARSAPTPSAAKDESTTTFPTSRAGDSETALQLFSQASAADPAWAVPQFLLGSEQASLGDMVRAETAFANAVLLAPDFAIARYQLGLVQFSAGRSAMALVTW